MGFYLGKFIYLYDAVMDLKSDEKYGNYNPMLLKFGNDLTEDAARQILVYYISECVKIFHCLPIVQDSVIIQNILYSGVWQEFEKKFKGHGHGSTEV